MKLSNKFSLPDPFVAAVRADDYERGTAEFTATELIKPSRILIYSRIHDKEMVEDVSERVWAFQGQTKHVVLERAARADPDRYIVEKRLETVLPGVNSKISAQFDLFDKKDGTLYDWKETSVWKFMVGDTKEWEQQANINLYCCRMNDINVKRLINIAILKDWKAREARFGRKPDYPKCPVHVLPLPMWSIGEAQAFITERIEKHRREAANPPVCTKAERWQRDGQWCVMQKGRKRALRCFPIEDLAFAAMKQYAEKMNKIGLYVEERPAEPVRCLDFCSVQSFCDFGRKQMELFDQRKDGVDSEATDETEIVPKLQESIQRFSKQR